MTTPDDPQTAPEPTLVYQIRVKGHLGPQGLDWFDGLTVALEENGETLLTCPVMDQSALHGVLKKIRDLGMPLLSVNQVTAGQPDSPSIKQSKEIY